MPAFDMDSNKRQLQRGVPTSEALQSDTRLSQTANVPLYRSSLRFISSCTPL